VRAFELSAGTRAGELRHRYAHDDLGIFTPDEEARFVRRPDADPQSDTGLAFELLYRLEPDLYERLARAERLHPAILDWLPAHVRRVVEVGAGTGRLTTSLVGRCEQLIAVEPAASLREVLRRRLASTQLGHRASVRDGFFDALPVATDWADLVIACSALTDEPAHGGDAGLREMDRVCRPPGKVVIIWPNHLDWLTNHGFTYVSFGGAMAMEFASADEAVELAEVFYSKAAAEIRRRGDRRVPYELLGVEPPRDLAYKEIPA
jgi:SAM-dependent methyltransferase